MQLLSDLNAARNMHKALEVAYRQFDLRPFWELWIPPEYQVFGSDLRAYRPVWHEFLY